MKTTLLQLMLLRLSKLEWKSSLEKKGEYQQRTRPVYIDFVIFMIREKVREREREREREILMSIL